MFKRVLTDKAYNLADVAKGYLKTKLNLGKDQLYSIYDDHYSLRF